MEQTKKMPREKKGNQPDKTQSHEIPKPRTYDFFPTARAAFIGKKHSFKEDASLAYLALFISIGLSYSNIKSVYRYKVTEQSFPHWL